MALVCGARAEGGRPGSRLVGPEVGSWAPPMLAGHASMQPPHSGQGSGGDSSKLSGPYQARGRGLEVAGQVESLVRSSPARGSRRRSARRRGRASRARRDPCDSGRGPRPARTRSGRYLRAEEDGSFTRAPGTIVAVAPERAGGEDQRKVVADGEQPLGAAAEIDVVEAGRGHVEVGADGHVGPPVAQKEDARAAAEMKGSARPGGSDGVLDLPPIVKPTLAWGSAARARARGRRGPGRPTPAQRAASAAALMAVMA